MQEELEDRQKENKKLETVKVDIELKSLVSRIKGYTQQIKERVKKTRELSESYIEEGSDDGDDEDT